ncbi:hypothetical protein DFH09DRAFT_1352923 [Mycena vulgaris]|nr:hypothetical protein DFH09DRAFT_1352923 [Mycena vulgaris]
MSDDNFEGHSLRSGLIFASMTHEQREAARRAIGRSGARTHMRPARERQRRRDGSRAPRDEPLVEKELYKNGVVPAAQLTTNPDHACAICLNTMAHPVIYCYACLRIWLQLEWVCPLCKTILTRKPRCDRPTGRAIAKEFPEWAKSSHVDYAWDGLTFPRVPRVVVSDSDSY